MARTASPEIDALLESGAFESHLYLDITLRDGTLLHFSKARFDAGATEYLGRVTEFDTLKMSLTEIVDHMNVRLSNIDKEMGQSVTGASNLFNNAMCVHGMAFKDPVTGAVHLDEKIPGDIVPGDVEDETVSATFYSEIEMGFIAGTTLGEAFPFSEPARVIDRVDPNDLGSGDGRYPIHGGGRDDFWGGRDEGGFRHGELNY